MNALLQLLRVQHHHEREQLIAKQQEEMQQFVQHLQKLSPSQLQHIVSSQVNSVHTNRLGKNTPVEGDSKSPDNSTSPYDDTYSVSQSTPSEGKSAASNGMMPSFYLHNPSTTSNGSSATTPGHINKLFLQFPSKKAQSPSQPPTPLKACTPPHFPKAGQHYLGSPSSHSSLDLTRQRHQFSRSQSDSLEGSHLLHSKDSCASLPPDIINNIPHTNPSHSVSKPTKQAFNEKQVSNYHKSFNIKERMLNHSNKINSPSSQLTPLTPREDMAELSASLTNSDIFTNLQFSSMTESSGNACNKQSIKSVASDSNKQKEIKPYMSTSEIFVRGIIKLQSALRGRNVRLLLRSQTVQHHIQTLSEVGKLASQFHKDIIADNIKKADIDFHRALYHQEQVARTEVHRLFHSASFAEQRKVINRDNVHKNAKNNRKRSAAGQTGKVSGSIPRRCVPPAPAATTSSSTMTSKNKYSADGRELSRPSGMKSNHKQLGGPHRKILPWLVVIED